MDSPNVKDWHKAVAVQTVVAGLMMVIPFGFDHRSSWGLDFTHFTLALLFLIALSVRSIYVAAIDHSVVGLLLALAIPVLVVWLN